MKSCRAGLPSGWRRTIGRRDGWRERFMGGDRGLRDLGGIAGLLETARVHGRHEPGGAADLLDALGAVAAAAIEEKRHLRGSPRDRVAFPFRRADRRKLATLCLGDAKRPHDRGRAGLLHQPVFQHALRGAVVRREAQPPAARSHRDGVFRGFVADAGRRSFPVGRVGSW